MPIEKFKCARKHCKYTPIIGFTSKIIKWNYILFLLYKVSARLFLAAFRRTPRFHKIQKGIKYLQQQHKEAAVECKYVYHGKLYRKTSYKIDI